MKKSVIFAVIALCLLPSVMAFGIASDYFDNNTLLLAPNAEYEYRVNVQNAGGDAMYVRITLNGDNDIVHLNNSDAIPIPAKSYDTQVPLFVSIPWYAKEGRTYDIGYEVQPVSGPGGGGVGLNLVLSRGFTVKVDNAGFIARGLKASDKKSFGEITSNSVKKVYSYKYEIVGMFAMVFALLIIVLLVWNRTGMVVGKLWKKDDSNDCEDADDAEELDLSYRTLPEFYRVMSSIDGQTFDAYRGQYKKEMFAWLKGVGGEKLARELAVAGSRKEFLQRLKNELKS